MKKVLLISLLSIAIFTAKSQNTDCKVLLDSLKGTYEGGCKNGKAEGKGKATGIDTYDGDWKNGLPEGNGKYTWKNGDFYEGEWKKGLKEGKGELHVTVNGNVVEKHGYWKKDVYKGQNLKAYIIHDASSGVGRVEVTKIDGSGNSITIELQSMGGGQNVMTSKRETAAGGNSEIVETPTTTNSTMTGITIKAGNYYSKSTNMLNNKEVTTIRNVIFPFRASFVFDQNSNTVDIEFFEEGNWMFKVPIIR
jgi:hypothetical protein